ncbi:MAG TPA: hypothetical protein VL832_11785 [Puia sp.]|nr:hypothetical protein [Puia sp.]
MKIVNIIPPSMSGESHQDSSPNIAVNPNNTKEIVISAFTPDPNGKPNAPVYVSVDGGDTWTLKNIIPGSGATGTAGITLKYGQTGNQLYAAILKGSAPGTLDILRTTNPAGGATMTELDSTLTGIEQPYVAAATVSGGPDAGKDRLYIGMNVLQSDPFPGPDAGKTSTIRQTMQAQAGVPVFSSISLESRNKSIPAFQDSLPRNGPQVRPAVHNDGTVYAVFYSWKTWADLGDGNGLVTSDVVLVRDDNWGQSAAPYGSLIDSGDGHAGQRIAVGVPITFYSQLGQERIGGELAIAVDPGNSSTVYVVWAELIDDGGGGEIDLYTLHLRRSTDKGQTWSHSDLLTISNGKNPGVAINNKGQIGYLYQQLTGTGNSQRWETHLAFSEDAAHWNDMVLATVRANTPPRQFFPYIGDYANIMSVGDTFYGVFCANNTPSLPNFPQGVKYQRSHDFTTKTLFNLDGITPVAASIDPFFFMTGFIPPAIKLPSQDIVGIIVIILFGIINDGGGAYIDGSGHIHIVGPGDPGPLWAYLVSLAEYRLATAINSKAGLEMQKLALQNVIDLASSQIAQINGQLGQIRKNE